MENNRRLIAESRMVIASSGTATLETGIIGRPMVVIYKTGRITYWIARQLVQIDKIALINITAGKKIVPELIQDEADPRRIASEVNRVLADTGQLKAIVEQLNDVTDMLGRPGAAERAAQAIREFINC
jgi:lipid-A-disaccharide synthase